MQRLSAVLFFMLILMPLAQGQELAVPDRSCVCKEGAADLFEEPVHFGFGPYAGQCVDSCRFRRARVLSPEAGKKLGADKNHLVFANVLHQGEYWTARVPLDRVVEVDVFFERFLSEISHVALRFRFDPKTPVLLYPQSGPAMSLPAGKLSDLVISAEAVPARGNKFRFFESSLGHYLLDYRVLSLDDTFSWMVTHLHHSVLQFRLNLSPDSTRQLLQVAVRDSESKSFQSAYKLLTNNCATSLVSMVEQSVAFKPTMSDWIQLVNLQSAFPLGAHMGTINALSAMRVLDRDQPRKNLEDEYPIAHRAAGLLKNPRD